MSKERRLRAFEQAIGDFSATTRCLLSVSFVVIKFLFEEKLRLASSFAVGFSEHNG